MRKKYIRRWVNEYMKEKEKREQLKQECEELKERLERIEEDLKYQCVDCMNVKSDRYRKALEEIEEVCKNGAYDEFKMPLDECDMILDIINKAKGGEDERF